MKESVTMPRLLDSKAAKAHLTALDPRSAMPEDSWLNIVFESERDPIQALIHSVNDDGQAPDGEQISEERCAALRAFLEERVSVRERVALMKFVDGVPPHRTPALSLAAEKLPLFLKDRVRIDLAFANVGAAKTKKARWPTHDRRGVLVDVTIEGAGGELEITERWQCDSYETALNFGLALLLDRKKDLGSALCRCHAEGCGRFWLLPHRLTGKPTRNFCSEHEAEKKRLSDAERKRRERDRVRERAAARAAAKHK
jgi:hypothetical protein